MPRTVVEGTASPSARGFGWPRLLGGSKAPGPRERVGKYRLIAKLAIGGMAEIFLARVEGPQGFQKLVVLKRMLAQHTSKREMVRMFLDEARLMAGLTHPNITQVYDFGKARGSYFFTMEHVHGEDVGTVLAAATRQGGVIPLDRALAITVAAAAGLHYAHTKTDGAGRPLGIVHRDVTPSNVLVSYDGAVKVTDFGVAKWAAQSSETRHGTLKGKFPYMSPEQTRGEALDPRSDVFALGILLYELTTGTRLYEGASDFAVLSKIVNEDAPPPSTRVPDYPPELERIVLKALRRDREQRFTSAQELQLALEEIARERRLNTSPVALAQYMQSLFGPKVAAWQAARHAGKTLAEHLVAVTHAEGPDEGLEYGPDGAPLQRSVVFEGEELEREEPTATSPVRRRRRLQMLAAASLVVGLSVGVAAALRNRPAPAAARGEASRLAASAPAAPRVTPLSAPAAQPAEAPAPPRAPAAAPAREEPARAAAPAPAAARHKETAKRSRAHKSAAASAPKPKPPAAKPAAMPAAKPAVKTDSKPPKWDPDSLVPPK